MKQFAGLRCPPQASPLNRQHIRGSGAQFSFFLNTGAPAAARRDREFLPGTQDGPRLRAGPRPPATVNLVWVRRGWRPAQSPAGRVALARTRGAPPLQTLDPPPDPLRVIDQSEEVFTLSFSGGARCVHRIHDGNYSLWWSSGSGPARRLLRQRAHYPGRPAPRRAAGVHRPLSALNCAARSKPLPPAAAGPMRPAGRTPSCAI
jgi:hypothetical protein